MGQYHRLVNLDKKEWVDPHGLGLGVKQYEHTGCEGSLADAIYLLVMTSPASGGGDWAETSVSGRWVGDRVVILGDYTERIAGFPDEFARGLYTQVEREYLDITKEVLEGLSDVWGFDYEYYEGQFLSGVRRLSKV